ncbi:flagellar biosynthetic protein FliR, partial [Stenotrophomonas maltophilia]|uniref:flagellar biosynthetic protein FliR n=1 Tax=Stenotrophomonas maltophilia TaxID=40324 RepID=UPI001953D7C9
VMLMPGLGEVNVPARIRLGMALALTMILLPLHRAAYQVNLENLAPLPVLLVHEILVGLILGATARVTIS